MFARRLGLGLVRSVNRQIITDVSSTSAKLSVLSKRSLSTMHFTDSEEQKILVAQRKNRPTSPHLTIYQPQLTWIMSSFHRITGVYMAVGFYGLTCGYALFSVLGLPIDSNAIFEFYSSLPEWFKYGTKAAMAYPFVYHFANGIRHLVWDLAKELTIKGVYRTGYAVLATTALFGTYYTFFI